MPQSGNLQFVVDQKGSRVVRAGSSNSASIARRQLDAVERSWNELDPEARDEVLRDVSTIIRELEARILTEQDEDESSDLRNVKERAKEMFLRLGELR